MKRTFLALTAAVLLALAGLNTARPSAAGQTRLPPVAGADHVISMAVVRHLLPQGTGMTVTVRYSLAKGDGVVAYEGKVQGEAASYQDDVLRRLMQRATDDIAQILITGKVPTTPHRSELAGGPR